MRESNISITEKRIAQNNRDAMDELNRISNTYEHCDAASEIDYLGYSIGHYAAMRGHIGVLEFLERNGHLDLEAETSMRNTLLNLATQGLTAAIARGRDGENHRATITYLTSLASPHTTILTNQRREQEGIHQQCAPAA